MWVFTRYHQYQFRPTEKVSEAFFCLVGLGFLGVLGQNMGVTWPRTFAANLGEDKGGKPCGARVLNLKGF